MHIKRIPPHLSWHLYFIDQHPKLVVVCINGGLTSVIQLCDLISNKDLKQAIRVGHYEKEIKIAEIGDSPNNAHIKFKMPIDEMAVIAEYRVWSEGIQYQATPTLCQLCAQDVPQG